MKDKLTKHLNTTAPPYVGRGNRPAPQLTPRQLELIENWEAIDARANKVWNTGRPKPLSNNAEEVRRRIYNQVNGYPDNQLDIPIP